MIYALGAWRKQASDVLRDRVVFDALIYCHCKSVLHKGVATAAPPSDLVRLVSLRAQVGVLTGQDYNRSELYCDHRRHSVNIKRLRNRIDDQCLEEDSTSSWETLIPFY
jgi:hypothetical protein